MMCKMGNCRQWILPILIWLLVIFMAVNLVFYSIPRKLITVHSFTTNKQEYKTGDLIIGTIIADVHYAGNVTTSLYLLCNRTSYFIKTIDSYLGTTANKITTPMGTVPNDVYPPDCRVQVQTTFHIQVLPWLVRDQTVTYYSSNFRVIN
jgi:hypothetical protein